MKRLLFFVNSDDWKIIENIKKQLDEGFVLLSSLIEIYEIDEENNMRKIK